MAWVWVLIPLAGILMGGFSEWLKFRSKQEKIGTSTSELEEHTRVLREKLEASEEERQRLTERVQNLETIVTSQAWDTLHEAPQQEAFRDGRASRDGEETGPQPGDPEKAEKLARRVQR